MKTMTSRDFDQDVGRAKRMAREEPVLITDRGKPSHVLMSHEAFEKMSPPPPAVEAEPEPGKRMTLSEIFGDPRPEADFDWEPERLEWKHRPIDLD